jgi:hypothetical protein
MERLTMDCVIHKSSFTCETLEYLKKQAYNVQLASDMHDSMLFDG